MQPQQVGPYTIVGRLGHGGMGAVYEAVEQGSGTPVAVKILAAHLADDAGVRSRFQQEIETLKSLRHPGIVQLMAYGEDEGQPYFAMELVRGQALDKLLRNGRQFTWLETVAVATAVARALKVAHDSGVIHRDLKPANLLVPEQGTLADVKLADFGIAKFFGASGHTAAGNVVGTAEYMAPEQAAARPVDARSDIYSLGLVMFAMLTGKPPFRAGHYTEVMRMQQATPPPRLTTLLPDLPQPIDDVIQKMLAKNPADRPASALALGRLLATVEDEIATLVRNAKPVVIEPPAAGDLTARGVQPTDATLEVTTEHAAAPGEAHLFAPTQGVTGPPPADPTKRDAATRRPTEPAPANTQVGPARRSRHVSVEREKVIAEARERRASRRETRLQIVSAIGILLLMAAGGYLLARPRTADELCDRIEGTVAAASDPLDGMKDAESLIDQFLQRFPDDPRGDAQRAMKRRILVDRLEKRAELRDRRDKPPYLRIERDYRAAMDQDEPAERLAGLRAILDTRRDILAAAVGPEVDDDEKLVPDVDLWIEMVKKTADDVAQLVDVENRVRRQDAARKTP